VHSARAQGNFAFVTLRRGFHTLQTILYSTTDKGAVPKEMVKYAGKYVDPFLCFLFFDSCFYFILLLLLLLLLSLLIFPSIFVVLQNPCRIHC
jgi:hypothetical protein